MPDDVRHCGSCTNDCTNLANVSGTTTCSAGQCHFGASSCAPGWADCNGAPQDGCETNITQPGHCGSCTASCASDSGASVCSGSGAAYACVSGCPSAAPTQCGGACVDTTSNANHCGSCANACTTTVGHAQATCAGGKCGFACNSGFSACSGACVDEQNDANNCGGCGMKCAAGLVCSAGSCVCGAGLTSCTGACVNEQTDSANCGACGNKCGTGSSCSAGKCVCSAGLTACGNACVNEQTDNGNCGACGVSCGAGSSCSAGKCVCSAGLSACGSACVNEQTDSANCGACGNVCPGAVLGETCSAGHCQAYPIAAATSPFALATDGTRVYYLFTDPTAGVELASVPIAGGTVNGPFSAGGAVAIATDGVEVYYGGQVVNSSTGYVAMAPIGNLGLPSMVAGINDPPSAIFADTAGGFLFYYVKGAAIWQSNLQTANAPVLSTYGANGFVSQIGADTAQLFPQVYWSLSPPPLGAGGIYTQAIGPSSSAATTLSSAANVKGFSIQGANLYYADATGGTISRVPINGSAAPSAIALATAPVGLVADGANIYWIDGSSILKVPLSGGSGTPIATGQSATAITIDGSSVYWANSNGIVRYPK